MNSLFKDEMVHLDLTFITNEPGKTLKNRFEQLIRDCKFFDCLVAYFYVSGFHSIYKALQETEKIRILIGIGIGKETHDLALSSHSETKQKIEEMVENEIAESEDKPAVEEGIQRFMQWIREGKTSNKGLSISKSSRKIIYYDF